ncbi:MAG: RusA family crossover junction endodeoxyribonuclease [Alphaproteobacteria bacterium]|nr:RusA family crossover junction endodeoxyribonuclease [Alphaproteobacteria bacterium]
MEIEFPLEFLVPGTPVSHQARRTASIVEWKSRVRKASSDPLPEGHFSTENPVAVTLYYFPQTEMMGDVDNIVKPILDALSRHIYSDDKQVERILIQKFEPGKVFQFSSPSCVLSEALQGDKPLLYVRLTDDLTEGLM